MTEFTHNMEIIASLSDTPNDGADGLTAQQLKERFDEGGMALKQFINETLIPEILTALAAKGDMAKTVYDTDEDGIVDHAVLADSATTAATATSATKAAKDGNGDTISSTYSKTNHTHTPSSIGAAASSHTHGGADITSPAVATLGARRIFAGTGDISSVLSSMSIGDIYLKY